MRKKSLALLLICFAFLLIYFSYRVDLKMMEKRISSKNVSTATANGLKKQSFDLRFGTTKTEGERKKPFLLGEKSFDQRLEQSLNSRHVKNEKWIVDHIAQNRSYYTKLMKKKWTQIEGKDWLKKSHYIFVAGEAQLEEMKEEILQVLHSRMFFEEESLEAPLDFVPEHDSSDYQSHLFWRTQQMAFESAKRVLTPQEFIHNAVKVLQNCQRSSVCATTVEYLKSKGLEDREILAHLPDDYSSIYFSVKN